MVHKQDRRFLMYTFTSSHEKAATLREMMKYMKRWEETHSSCCFVGYTSIREITSDSAVGLLYLCRLMRKRRNWSWTWTRKGKTEPWRKWLKKQKNTKSFWCKIKCSMALVIFVLSKQSAACHESYLKYWCYYYYLNKWNSGH